MSSRAQGQGPKFPTCWNPKEKSPLLNVTRGLVVKYTGKADGTHKKGWFARQPRSGLSRGRTATLPPSAGRPRPRSLPPPWLRSVSLPHAAALAREGELPTRRVRRGPRDFAPAAARRGAAGVARRVWRGGCGAAGVAASIGARSPALLERGVGGSEAAGPKALVTQGVGDAARMLARSHTTPNCAPRPRAPTTLQMPLPFAATTPSIAPKDSFTLKSRSKTAGSEGQ